MNALKKTKVHLGFYTRDLKFCFSFFLFRFHTTELSLGSCCLQSEEPLHGWCLTGLRLLESLQNVSRGFWGFFTFLQESQRFTTTCHIHCKKKLNKFPLKLVAELLQPCQTLLTLVSIKFKALELYFDICRCSSYDEIFYSKNHTNGK